MQDKRAAITLVLSAGGSWGGAHIGVLDVLEREGVAIGRIVGASAGAFVGGLCASGLRAADLLVLARKADWNTLFAWRDLSFSRRGLLKGDRIEAFLREHLGAPSIEQFVIPFAAVAADIVGGERVVFDRGDAVRAIRASVAIPGLLEPVEWDGKVLVDGAFASPLPVSVARSYGTAPVAAVDVMAGTSFFQRMKPDVAHITAVQVLDRSAGVLTKHLRAEEAAAADVVMTPDVPARSWMDFSYDEAVIEAGREAARKALPAIRAFYKPQAAQGRNWLARSMRRLFAR